MSDWYGINYPFSGGIQNVLSRQIGTRIIKNDILQLILTNPGERVFRPNYGVGIKTYLYEQLDEESINILEDRIKSQIYTYEPRVSIGELNISTDRDNHILKIYMILFLIQSPDETFNINLNLPIVG